MISYDFYNFYKHNQSASSCCHWPSAMTLSLREEEKRIREYGVNIGAGFTLRSCGVGQDDRGKEKKKKEAYRERVERQNMETQNGNDRSGQK
jgi:hypothetical protein